MITTFTKSNSRFGCYAENNNKQDQYLENELFTILDVLNADVPLKDKAWFIRRNCQFSDLENREFAIGCALLVLPIYESKYPENKAPREAIEAAKAYLKNEITREELYKKRRAAAYATDAADAAAYATDAAYAAAYAADATDAAYAAAYAADAAAKKEVSYKYLLLQFFIDFTKA